jgi:hypothetical protein
MGGASSFGAYAAIFSHKERRIRLGGAVI